MTDVTTQRIIDRFNARVRAYARSGITWGTNNYPANALESWFFGSNAGPSGSPTAASLGDNTNSKYGTGRNVVASTVKNNLQNLTQQYSSVQRVRILIYRTKTGYSNNTKENIYDGTAVGHMASIYRNTNNLNAGALVQGNELTWTSVYNFMETCRSRLVSQKSTTQRTLTRDVCHDSCHMSCHSNRGRR